MDRRDFLRKLLVAGAGVAVAPQLLVEPYEPKVIWTFQNNRIVQPGSWEKLLASTLRAYLPVLRDTVFEENVHFQYFQEDAESRFRVVGIQSAGKEILFPHQLGFTKQEVLSGKR